MKNKINSLKVGKFIAELLKEIIPIYAVIADHTATYPFAVYRRSGLTCLNTKDKFNYTEHVLLTIAIASKDYDESVELADKVKTALEHRSGIISDIYVEGVDTVDASEDWQNDAFIQSLTFRIKVTT